MKLLPEVWAAIIKRADTNLVDPHASLCQTYYRNLQLRKLYVCCLLSFQIGPQSTVHSKSMSITSISSDVVSTRQTSYLPDFTLKAIGNVMYIKIRRAHYMAAYRATLMQRENKTPQVWFYCSFKLMGQFTWGMVGSVDIDILISCIKLTQVILYDLGWNSRRSV